MLIKVKAFPNSKKDRIVEKDKDSFEVYVKEEAERGMANKKIIEVVARHFDIPQFKVKMIRGSKSQNKIFDIKN